MEQMSDTEGLLFVFFAIYHAAHPNHQYHQH